MKLFRPLPARTLALALLGVLAFVPEGALAAPTRKTTKARSTAAPVRPDAALFAEAKQARATLEGSRKLQASRAEWDKVVGRYRRLVVRYPKSGYSDDALLAVGDLERAMAGRFKRPSLLDEAVTAYETLADDYPSSRHAETALFSAFEIAQKSGDKKRLLEAVRSYMEAFPDSARVAVVKSALRTRAPEKAASLPSPPPPGLASLYDLRFWSGESATRVVIDVARKVKIDSERISHPDRLWIDLQGTRLHPRLQKREFAVGDGLLEKVRVAQNRDDVVRVVLDFKEVGAYSVFYLEDPLRLVVDVKGAPRPPEAAVARATRPEPVIETILDADDDARVDDPGAPPPRPGTAMPVPTPAPASRRAPALAGAVPSASQGRPVNLASTPTPASGTTFDPAPTPTPATTPTPAPVDRLASRRLNGLAAKVEPSAAPTPRPKPLPLTLEGPPRSQPAVAAALPPLPPPDPVGPAQANRAGSYSLARQLGLGARRIVIDAGHGGHDPGTIGRRGLMEKDLVLDVALRLEKMVRAELGAEVVMTRATDVFIPLEERTAIANSRGADLFLSIHANSSRNPRARGIETYFLSFARDPHAEEVAARENAISAATMKDLQGLVKAIALNSKIDESRDFAASVQEAMVENVRGRYPVSNRGVHTAPFYVLIGANMPSVLAEIAFVSNPEDEKLLKTGDYRETIAKSLLRGVRSYLEGLSRPPARALTGNPRRTRVAEGSR